MTVLVVGASGFVGSALCRKLTAKGASFLPASRSGSGVAIDLTDQSAVDSLLSSMDFSAVVNLAGCGVTAGTASADEMNAVNVGGALNLGRALLLHQPTTRMIAVASSVEEPLGLLQESGYGYSKALASARLAELFEASGRPLLKAALHNVYGPGQPRGRFVSSAFEAFGRQEPFTIMHPLRERDFCFIDDVVEGLAALVLDPDALHGEYEIGTGVGTSLWRAATTVCKEVGASLELVRKSSENQSGDDPYAVRVADPRRTGFIRCRTGFSEGVRMTGAMSP